MSSLYVKTQCNKCRKKSGGFKFKCKFCSCDYCIKCLQPEYHDCSNLVICQSKSKEILKNQLLSNKCIKPKVEKI